MALKLKVIDAEAISGTSEVLLNSPLTGKGWLISGISICNTGSVTITGIDLKLKPAGGTSRLLFTDPSASVGVNVQQLYAMEVALNGNGTADVLTVTLSVASGTPSAHVVLHGVERDQ